MMLWLLPVIFRPTQERRAPMLLHVGRRIRRSRVEEWASGIDNIVRREAGVTEVSVSASAAASTSDQRRGGTEARCSPGTTNRRGPTLWIWRLGFHPLSGTPPAASRTRV